ncbi:response regulator [Marinobacter salinexigens]|uniref:histidine kinase n=1 Tax=Marinobacter salinexigens TaxID=2919747 RepID=A0A5B0V9H2_9GAMM|nr:response regulator [Marinobacter salinexigens]KAA1171282.1 response regulator [Marinobacter salinexigens]
MTEAVSENSEVTVLLVDDNPQNLKVLYETLKDKGYRLLIANEGEKALDLASRHQPEVILLDIMMPEMDGYEVCSRLKSDPATADCAVVFLSALDDLQAKVKGFSLGGADYISKPFQSQEVIARVKTHAQVIRLERELQARNRELQGDQTRILNSISEGIYGLDENGVIEFANPAAATIMGCPVDELVGRSFFETHFATACDGTDGLPARATCEKGIAENQRDIRMRRIDGSCFPAEYRSTPKLDNGELHGAVVVFRDVTIELENEAELEAARALVQEQRDQLAHASRLTTMGEMAAGFAHEINQPLTAITNYARVSKRMMAKESPDLELLGETLDKIEAQSHRASEIIRRIRSFMKKPATGKEVISVPTLLEDTRQFAEVDMRNNEGGIALSVPDGLPDVAADPIQVQQVALNLIRNALEATRSADASDPVEVSARVVSTGCVRIEVRDHGIGLPPDAEEKLFLPFYTTKSEGMGIGLATCRSLIQAQGGDIGFERPDSGGALFFFTLPAVGAEGESVCEVSQSLPAGDS